MNSGELRKKYLDFFQERGHTIIPSASLIPENDPSALFISAGMQPLVTYLIGEKHPGGKRLAGFQKCIRTIDIDEVGDQWHLTFFEMLGNWSLGDYWKEESINWSYEFLVEELKIPVEKIAVSVFKGDDDVPFDEESCNAWKNLGISEKNIYKYGKKENWWGPIGEIGPCGPDTEIFYITGKEPCGPDCQPSCSCGKYVEIWNDVFMEYYKNKEGVYNKAKQRNIDTGMGLERMIAVLNNYKDNYHCDQIWPIIKKIEELSGKKYSDDLKMFRIIADHVRAATFILGDNSEIKPSNLDSGYILRRLIRRAVRFGNKLGIDEVFTDKIAEVVINQMEKVYPELKNNKDAILDQLVQEEEKFAKTIKRGMGEFNKWYKAEVYWSESESKADEKVLKRLKKKPKRMPGYIAFKLFTTYGFPIELTEEIAREKGIVVDIKNFQKEFKKHQELSRKGAEKKFKGGLANDSGETKKLHTATHLLQAALRKVLGSHVRQKGSNITPERLRFDFNYDKKMTSEQLKEVEDLVNKWIVQSVDVRCEEMPFKEAKQKGILGLFDDKYGDVVKVYTVGDISCELCGGPHVENTNELGKFKILKEKSASAGIRRIKAILE